MTTAYFREYASDTQQNASPSTAKAAGAQAGQHTFGDLYALLTSAGVIAEPPAISLRLSAPTDQTKHERYLAMALLRLGEERPASLLAWQEALQYLANVLCAGASLRGRRLRPVEAAQVAMATCELGLCSLLDQDKQLDDAAQRAKQAVELVRHHHADQFFQVGWKRLMWQVSLPAAEALRDQLARRSKREDSEPWLRDIIDALQSGLRAQRPWDAHEVWESQPTLVDEPHRQTWLGLLSHIPLRQGALVSTPHPQHASFDLFESPSDCASAVDWFAHPPHNDK